MSSDILDLFELYLIESSSKTSQEAKKILKEISKVSRSMSRDEYVIKEHHVKLLKNLVLKFESFYQKLI
jgi:hypothetical protein